jgi:hypothetical protein
MSYSVSTGRVETSPVQNDSGSVSVAIFDDSAGFADEGPLRQQQAGLGSRTATAARHRRVGGRHQHHLSARPLGILDQHRFARADGAVGGPARHTGLSQKLWLEVFNGQRPMVGNNSGGPLARRVLPLAADFLGQLGDGAFRAELTVRRPLAVGRFAQSHCSLPACELSAGVLAIFRMRQVVFRVSGSRHCAHSPIDADDVLAVRQCRVVTAHHEAGVPMPETVAIDTNTARTRGQLPRPHNRNRQPASQTQAASFNSESPPGVVQARPTALSRFELPAPLSIGALGAEVAQHLLLGHHRALAQPIVLAPPAGKHVVSHPLAGLVEPRDRLVPHPPASVPLAQQCRDRSRAGAQPVSIAHDGHTAKVTALVRQHRAFVSGRNAKASWVVHR